MTLIQAIQSPPSSVELDRGSPHLNGFGQIPETLKIPRPGQWLEGDVGLIQKWVHEMIEHVAAHPKPLLPVIEEFKDLIESSPAIFMLFTTMFEEVPAQYTFPENAGDIVHRPRRIENYKHMLEMFNYVLTTAPAFNDSSMVGLPLNAMLDCPMKTQAGAIAFLHPEVNTMFKKLLDHWSRFLSSPDSTSVLNSSPSGWFGPSALEAIRLASGGSMDWRFENEYVCDPTAPHYGFKSWDDFFTRRFRRNVRPVQSVNDDDVIVNACESAPYRITRNVQSLSRFWMKEQAYSLKHMLNHDPLASQFVGGTIYQAFLSAMSYHRWHAPVSGTIVKTTVVPGTYFSEYQNHRPDEHTIVDASGGSLGFMAAVATRALVFIRADNEKIGLMCFVAVGMADVSTCDVRVYEGQHVSKGEEIGMFHFGGSTHCLVFGPQVEIVFHVCEEGEEVGLNADNIRLSERIATVM